MMYPESVAFMRLKVIRKHPTLQEGLAHVSLVSRHLVLLEAHATVGSKKIGNEKVTFSNLFHRGLFLLLDTFIGAYLFLFRPLFLAR